MDYSADHRKKSQYYRIKIRRAQIDHIFSQQRESLLQHHQQNNSYELVTKLKTSLVQQKQFIDQCSLKLTGQPSASWKSTLQDLSASTMAFKGDFDYWFESSIILSLTNFIKESNTEFNLVPLICSIFSDQAYLAWDNSTNFNEKLMEYEIMEHVVRHGFCKAYSIPDRVQILRFCGNVCQYSDPYQYQFVRSGGASWLISLGNQILQKQIVDQHTLLYFLLAARAIIQFKSKSSRFELPNLNMLIKLIPIFAMLLIQQNMHERTITNSLQNLDMILKYDRDVIYTTILNFNKLTKAFINYLSHQNTDVRFCALNIICSLAFVNDQKIALDLVQMGLLNQMQLAFNIPHVQEHSKYCQTFVNTLSNIAAGSCKLSIVVFQHPVFDIIISQLQHTQAKNKMEAFYCLNTIVIKLTFHGFQRLLYDYDILHILVLGLGEMRQIDAGTAIEILCSINILIERGEQLYHKEGNLVTQQLENKYNFVHTLEEIIQNTHHEMLRQNAETIHKKIAGQLWNHTPIL